MSNAIGLPEGGGRKGREGGIRGCGNYTHEISTYIYPEFKKKTDLTIITRSSEVSNRNVGWRITGLLVFRGKEATPGLQAEGIEWW